MSASKILALTSLFLTTTFAQTEWKEFTSSDGSFRVLFPDNPQQQTGTERNLHQFSATAPILMTAAVTGLGFPVMVAALPMFEAPEDMAPQGWRGGGKPAKSV